MKVKSPGAAKQLLPMAIVMRLLNALRGGVNEKLIESIGFVMNCFAPSKLGYFIDFLLDIPSTACG